MQQNYFNNKIFKITFSGVMLVLIIFFQYIEQFMPTIIPYIKINISITFILIIIHVNGFWWGFLVLILRFIIGPGIDKIGYSSIGIFNHAILFFFGFIFILIYWFLKQIIFKNIKNQNYKLILVLILSTITISLLACLLNYFVIIPIYLDLFLISGWEINKSIILLFFISNLIKFSLISFIYFGLWKRKIFNIIFY